MMMRITTLLHEIAISVLIVTITGGGGLGVVCAQSALGTQDRVLFARKCLGREVLSEPSL